MAIFATLPADELKNIVDRMSVEHYPKGDTFAVQGQTEVKNIYIITKGQLSLYLEEQGQRTLTGHHKKGDVFGGITILLNGGISKKIFLELCAGYKAFYEYFMLPFDLLFEINPFAADLVKKFLLFFLDFLVQFVL